MDKTELRSKVLQGLTLQDLSEHFGKGKTTVRYWLRKYDLNTVRGPHGKHLDSSTKKTKCGTCGETDASKFYGHKRTICGKCHSAYTLRKGHEKRKYALELLGNKCQVCGYNDYMCSLDIHHKEPEKKDLQFRTYRGWSLERIEKELETCVLLCKNCHAAVHANELNIGA